jgi:glutaredoxin-related protein
MLDEDFTREQLFEEFPTARTFPQIRVDGKSIGGYDQLAEYVKHGDVWED